MNAHNNDLARMSARQLRARRRALAARLGDVQQVLAGSLTEQVEAVLAEISAINAELLARRELR